MKHITDLYIKADYARSKEDKIALLLDYFNKAQENDVLWLAYLIAKKCRKRFFTSQMLKGPILEFAGFNNWIFEISKVTVGDTVETLSLMLPVTGKEGAFSFSAIAHHVFKEKCTGGDLHAYWKNLSINENLVLNKFITGTLNLNVTLPELAEAMSVYFDTEKYPLVLNLEKDWSPDNTSLHNLLESQEQEKYVKVDFPTIEYVIPADIPSGLSDKRVYPFYNTLLVQVLKNRGGITVVNRTHEPLQQHIPWIQEAFAWLPERNTFFAFVLLLENEGLVNIGPDIKNLPSLLRRNQKKLVFLFFGFPDHLREDKRTISKRSSSIVDEKSRSALLGPLGTINEILLQSNKTFNSIDANGIYLINERKGHLLVVLKKYKLITKLIYAERRGGIGHTNFNVFSVAVLHEGELVKIATVENSLSDMEKGEIDGFILKNTEEKFGPVRKIKPDIVLEIEFTEAVRSNRHKAGVNLKNVSLIRQLEPDSKIDHLEKIIDIIKRS